MTNKIIVRRKIQGKIIYFGVLYDNSTNCSDFVPTRVLAKPALKSMFTGFAGTMCTNPIPALPNSQR